MNIETIAILGFLGMFATALFVKMFIEILKQLIYLIAVVLLLGTGFYFVNGIGEKQIVDTIQYDRNNSNSELPSQRTSGDLKMSKFLNESRSQLEEKRELHIHIHFEEDKPILEEKVVNQKPFLKVSNKSILSEVKMKNKSYQEDLFCGDMKLTRARFVIVESFCADLECAKERAQLLKANGFKRTHYFSTSCYESEIEEEGFLIVLDRPFQSLASAEEKLKACTFNWYSADLGTWELQVYNIKPKRDMNNLTYN